MNHAPFYQQQHIHHPTQYPPSQQQHHQQDHHYLPPTMNHHHMTPPTTNIYHQHHSFPSSNHHLYTVNSNYQNSSGFGYQPHLHSYSSAVPSYPPVNEPPPHYYDMQHHQHGSSGYMPSQPSTRMDDKPYDYYPPPPPRYSTGKEYGRVNNNNNNKPNHPNINNNMNNNNKRITHYNNHEQHNKPLEKIGTTTAINNLNNSTIKKPQLENKRKIKVDIQPNKKQKQTVVPTSSISTEKPNEIIVNNSNDNKNEEKSSDEKLDIYRVLRVCAENDSMELSENDIFKYFPNALKVRKENQRDFLVEFSSLVDMIPYVEAETLQEEDDTVNISIPKSLIPPEYANNTQKLVLEFIDFLKQKQPQKPSNVSTYNPSIWNKLISSIKIPQNVSPYELLDFRKRRVKKVLGKTEFGILIHEKPKITEKIGFPLFPNPNMTNKSQDRFFFFAFCKTGTTFLGKDEISKCFPNAKSVHFDPGDHRIIVELNNQNDFNAYKKISHSGKLIVRNHSFLLRKANPKDIPPDILNPPPQRNNDESNIPTNTEPNSTPSSEETSTNVSTPMATPDKNILLKQLRQQMDHPPETPKQDPKELRSALLAQMKTPLSSVPNSKSDQSLESFISLDSDSESDLKSEGEDEMIDETEEDVRSFSSESNHDQQAPSSPQPQTPSKDKTQLLSALREQMQQSAEKKKEPTPTVSASSSNLLGIKRKTFASHYALFHGKFNK